MSSFEVTILSIILMIFLGYFLKRINFLKSSDIELLNKIVINIAMPCMIFMSIYSTDMDLLPRLSIMPIIGLIVAGSSGLITFIILSMKKYSKIEKWSIVVPATLGNTAFLGFPVILGVFGNNGFLRAIFYDISSLIAFLSLSIILMINFGGSIKEVLKKVFSFPILWAVIFGILFSFFNISIGEVVPNIFNYLGSAAIPLIMISLGLSLNFKEMKEKIHATSLTVLVKLIVAPVIAFITVKLFGLSGMEYTIGIVEAAMPSGMLTLVLAITYDLDFELTADCVFVTTIFSLIIFPIVLMIV
jgi:auxin efflux carrier (AEC)